ncbi:MAG: dipeptidase [Spirochaetaceae bacterium]
MEQSPVFDGHNDLLARLFSDPDINFFTGEKAKHISLGALRQGGFSGGLFAVFIPPTKEEEEGGEGEGSAKLPSPVPLDRAREVSIRQFSILLRLIAASDGALRLVRSVAEIEAAREAGAIAVVAHMEGAEGISDSLEELDLFHAAGLRSLGPLWSRPNRFGYGVPIYRQGSPDTAPGLTAAGKRLLRRCNELRILFDLSHLSERGFWDVAELSDAPLVASHSNAWSLCKSSRNLTDRQLEAIGRSGGLVGLNFGTLFLRKDGKVEEDTPISVMIDHLRHLVSLAGIDHVGFGSDFDGTVVPKEIGSAAGLPKLLRALGEAGFSEGEVEKLRYANWLRVLKATWGG